MCFSFRRCERKFELYTNIIIIQQFTYVFFFYFKLYGPTKETILNSFVSFFVLCLQKMNTILNANNKRQKMGAFISLWAFNVFHWRFPLFLFWQFSIMQFSIICDSVQFSFNWLRIRCYIYFVVRRPQINTWVRYWIWLPYVRIAKISRIATISSN